MVAKPFILEIVFLIGIKFNLASLISISSKNEQKLNDFGDKFKINPQKRFNNYTDVLSLNFDIAYVGLVNSLHKSLVKNLILKACMW